MNGEKLAREVWEDSTLPQLLQRLGCSVHFERWHPITYGEFDKKTNIIYVNLNAPICATRIILHELAHFLIQKNYAHLNLNRTEEEAIAVVFEETMFCFLKSS